jgi:predicted transcriptional regulator
MSTLRLRISLRHFRLKNLQNNLALGLSQSGLEKMQLMSGTTAKENFCLYLMATLKHNSLVTRKKFKGLILAVEVIHSLKKNLELI